VAAGTAADRFIVGLAVLGLLADDAAERPLVCLVDDAQWLDEASADVLGVVGRRLRAESVALLLAVRGAPDDQSFRGLPALTVDGLTDEDARSLLTAAVPGYLDEHIRDRIVAETRGNPLGLLELALGLSEAELAGVGPEWHAQGIWELEATRAAIAAARGDSREARAAAERAAADAEGDPRWFDRMRCAAMLAPVLVRAGQPGRAREVVELTLAARPPGFSGARLGAILAWLLYEEGDEAASVAALAAAWAEAGDQARHVVRRDRLGYTPHLWAMVFPLGMYSVATAEFGRVTGLPFLAVPARVAFWVALVAWVAVFAAMLVSLAAGSRRRMTGMRVGR